MKTVSVFLVIVALMAGVVGCADPAEEEEEEEPQYELTIDSTAGGQVTTPGEGTFNYTEGTVVDLVAEAEEGYRFVYWTGDVDAVDIVYAAITTLTVEGNCSITANFKPWVIEITNADIESDYPTSVQGGGTYTIKVELRVSVPNGKTGTLSVVANTETFYDPMPYTFRWLDPPSQEYSTQFGNGTHTAELSFVFYAPEVRRESWANVNVYAALFEGDEAASYYWRDEDVYYSHLTILPSAESAVDVKFTGTVESLNVFWDTYVIGAHIKIDEVTIEDPWSLLTAGNTVYVGLEAAPLVEELSVGVGDKVEVCCDYHPDTLALIWRPQHHITQVQAFLWV